jgi:hypothetical protein
VAGFALGFFAVNLLGGVLLAVGPGRVVLDALPTIGQHTKHLLELAGGVVALVVAAVLWHRRMRPRAASPRAALLANQLAPVAGATLAAVELPTALPYFAVIAAVLESTSSIPVQVGLLTLFNVIYIAPLLVILVLAVLPGAAPRLADLRTLLDRHGVSLLAGLLLAAGLVLLALGATGLT